MKYTTLLLATAGLAIAAAPAHAQDARDTHFDGLYIQGFGGYAMQDNDSSDRLEFDTDQNGEYGNAVTTLTGDNAFTPGFCAGRARTAVREDGCRNDTDGAEYGARIGVDARMGNFVVGGLVEVSKANARDYTSGFSITPASYAVRRELDYNVALRGRAGFTPGGGALFYATGGATYGKIDHDFATTNTANSFNIKRGNKGVFGWQAGGGTEIMLTNNMTLGLEYLYSRYNDDKSYVLVGPGTAPATNPFLLESGATRLRGSDTRFDFHSVRATVGFQF